MIGPIQHNYFYGVLLLLRRIEYNCWLRFISLPLPCQCSLSAFYGEEQSQVLRQSEQDSHCLCSLPRLNYCQFIKVKWLGLERGF